VRLGLTDQTTGWPAAVADTWDIDKRKCTRRGTRTCYATRGGFRGFGPQNPDGGPDADGWHVTASVRSLRGEATGEEARWLSDLGYVELD